MFLWYQKRVRILIAGLTSRTWLCIADVKCNISRETTQGKTSDVRRDNLRRSGQGSSGSLCVPPLRLCVMNFSGYISQ